MANNEIRVEHIWVDGDGKQVGARLAFNGGSERTLDVSVQELQQYSGKLDNAVVMKYGVRAKIGHEPTRKELERNTGKPVATYVLMHADAEVCRVYTVQNTIEMTNAALLPFYLTGENLTVIRFLEWLNYRIDNLSRTYMNRVYILRKVGRDRERILRDSCAISVTDNYWAHRSDVETTWQELKARRDTDKELANTALTGEISEAQYKNAVDDATSLYTIKGAFPKGVLREFILKKDNNAEHEAVASELGRVLDISVAEAEKQADGVVACRIFTSEDVSMVHARDLLHLTDYDTNVGDDQHRALYDYFDQQDRYDIMWQLERLYIFNYLVINLDFHYENFGFLYDSSTFEILGVAPAYDFNSAFAEYSDVNVFYEWITERLALFLRDHPDIAERLQSKEFIDSLSQADLTDEQKRCVRLRAEFICELSGL
ncbi:MAG: HipA domain-containing protein [Defluviitaleaceae bacterium]|nr:HipA domain-containing protein [Defluviitaleaceae bacterium]